MAPSAYLASSASTADLVSALLPTSHQSLPVPSSDVAHTKWSQGHSSFPPTGADAFKEKNWDGVSTVIAASTLLDGARDEVKRERLLAAMAKDSGAWLQALPISSFCGVTNGRQHLEDCRGTSPWLAPHIYQHCGAEV